MHPLESQEFSPDVASGKVPDATLPRYCIGQLRSCITPDVHKGGTTDPISPVVQPMQNGPDVTSTSFRPTQTSPDPTSPLGDVGSGFGDWLSDLISAVPLLDRSVMLLYRHCAMQLRPPAM
ncbi:hypothetical protein H4Q26_005154 [Puccinia striiformis f. sp. tritici PST-130]|nr:hypothetical protein H4Q26_005154 [Puccinia striiformis f. sp. tritici PST-130]